MSFWSTSAKILTGAAVGYLASSRREELGGAVRSLARTAQEGTAVAQRSGAGRLQRLSDSPALQPVRSAALRALKFAATVQQGMQEKEAELNRKYTEQQTSARPGEAQEWNRATRLGTESSAQQVLGSTEVSASSSDPAVVLDHEDLPDQTEQGPRRPASRDTDLPPEFFSGTSSQD